MYLSQVVYVRVIAIMFAVMLVTASVPAVVIADERAALNADRYNQQEAVQTFEQSAREGAEQAITALESEGKTIPAASREAAVVGALEAARSLEGVAPAPSAKMVRQAAYGAVYGALRGSGTEQLSTEIIRSAVSGAISGGSFAAALATSEGGNATYTQVQAAAQGAAEGAVMTAATLPTDQEQSLSGDYVSQAAYGGAGGSISYAGTAPIFGGSRTDSVLIYNAAFGGTAGALRGTAEQLANGRRVDLGHTLGVSLGASAGVLTATTMNPELTGRQLWSTAQAVARETVWRTQELTPQQMVEVAVDESIDRLVDDTGGDAIFPSPIDVPGFGVPILIGPPRDLDNDGRYEDVDGNRFLSYEDVVKLSIIIDASAERRISLSAEQRRAFDFNEDSVLDSRDIRALAKEIAAATNRTA